MADTGLASFVAGLAGNTRVPQVSNDAFYNQIIQNNINEKRLKEARTYQEQQTEKAMKYQKELMGYKLGMELEEERKRALAGWVAQNSQLVDETDKKSVDKYNKAYEAQRRLLWGGQAKLMEVMPKEKKPKSEGGLGKFFLGSTYGPMAEKAVGEGIASGVESIRESYGKYGVLGGLPGFGMGTNVMENLRKLQEAEKEIK
jgi:hypothetical protein